jgi:hypothetical protein
MSDFKSFVRSRKKGRALILSTSEKLSQNINVVLGASVLGLSIADREKFVSEVVEAANSDYVIDELSQSIGQPKEEETEDEFVNRSKSSLKNILKQRFMK